MSVLLPNASLHCLIQLLLGHSQTRKSGLDLTTNKQNAISVPQKQKPDGRCIVEVLLIQ